MSYDVQGNYGQGWETVTAEEAKAEAIETRNLYRENEPGIPFRYVRDRCSCSRHSDGSVTTMLCPIHAEQDPCLTMAQVTGRRRTGTIRRGTCTSCGHRSNRKDHDS